MDVNLSSERLPKLAVIGVYTASEAYPNTLYSLYGLQRHFDVKEINVSLLPQEGGAIRTWGNPLAQAWRVAWAHVRVLVKGLALRPRPECMFIPYPAPILLWAWSFVPRGLRPKRVVADAFISLYDTVVNDRNLLQPNSWRARLLWKIEQRAYRAADAVVVDTSQNADFYTSLFHLPRDRFIVIPLATNERDFAPTALSAHHGTFNILFIGTLIPLHGISTIVEAARLLEGRWDVRFTIVGTGQQADILQTTLDNGASNITWERGWKTPEQLATYIKLADICLGVFGSGSKAQRVCPYKVYAYACMGRPIITARTTWLEEAAEEFGEMPFAAVNAMDASALAVEIVRLVGSVVSRNDLAGRARRFYDAMLANEIALTKLCETLS